MELLSPISNISGNDLARILDVIRSAEREHWFKGLQQAELEIRGLQAALNQQPILDKIRQVFTGQKSPYRRDAEYQLSVCQREYDRILSKHPEAQQLSYEQLQERFGPAALNARKAYAIASAVIQRQLGLDPSAAQLLVSAAPEDLPEIVAGVTELSHRTTQAMAMLSGAADANYAAALLASLPPEQRSAAIAEAQALAALTPGD